MNILDITPADIERLKENKIVFGLLDERDVKILRKIDIHNTESYCASGFYRCRAGASFNGTTVYHIRPDYSLPAPTEADIIEYLKASEVRPSQWHPAAQEWARRHDGELIFEAVYKDQTGVTKIIACNKIIDCMSPCHVPHRLRADYGRKEEYVASLMPDNCVWKYFWQFGQKLYETSCGKRFTQDKYGNYCKHCGKPITEIANDTSAPV